MLTEKINTLSTKKELCKKLKFATKGALWILFFGSS